MFNENDLRFATERFKELEDAADLARRIAVRPWKQNSSPLWVRVFNTMLDRSRWTLVLKSEIARSMAPNRSNHFVASGSGTAESEIH